MNNILKNIIDNSKYNIKNAFEFKDFISSAKIPDGHKLTSYDAVSLYTNSDTVEATNILKRKWVDIKKFTNIDKHLFFEILDFCICDNVFFTYNDTIYKQIFGLAMGLSLAGTLSDVLLTELFDNMIPKLNYEPGFFKKYIDDIITTAPENQAESTQAIYNGFNSRLKFTYEVEMDNRINFLDTTVYHMSNNTMITDWYSKETSSNRLLNYLSAHPQRMKINIATSFVNRVLSLSHPIFKSKNIQLIRNILTKNNYPNKIIEKALKIHRTNTMQCQNSTTANKKEMTYSGMCYIPDLTSNIEKQLKISNDQLAIGPRPILKLQKVFSKMKTKIKPMDQTNAIYRIQCKEPCEEPFYIGETFRRVGIRTNEHETDYENRFKPSGKTALIRHCLGNDDREPHEPDFTANNIKVIDREAIDDKRKFMEACYIWMYDKKAQNIKRNTKDLHTNYTNILKKFKDLHTE